MSADEILNLVHELETSQVKLEMQNKELQMARLELEEQRYKYSEFYDFAPVGYLTTNTKGTTKQINLILADMLGVPRGRLINKFFSKYVLKEDHNIYYEHFNEMLKTKKKQVCELRIIRKNGDPFRVRCISIFVQDSESKDGLIRSVFSDITETRQAEDKLRESEEKYRSFIERANDGIIISQDRVIKFVNSRLAKMFG